MHGQTPSNLLLKSENQNFELSGSRNTHRLTFVAKHFSDMSWKSARASPNSLQPLNCVPHTRSENVLSSVNSKRCLADTVGLPHFSMRDFHLHLVECISHQPYLFCRLVKSTSHVQGVVSFFIASDGKIQCILLTQLVVIMLHRLLSIIELCICAFLTDCTIFQ